MILSKNLLYSRRPILISLRNYKVSSSIRCLRSSIGTKCSVVHTAVIPEFGSVISRFASSYTTGEKDVILQVPGETISNQHTGSSNTVPVESNHSLDASAQVAIPDNLPEIVTESILPVNTLGEVTLQSVGLGSAYTPVGWLQRTLEFLHVTFDIPWWSSIAICVVVARVLLFPLVIRQQRNSVLMHNVMPEMTAIQTKMQTAKVYGNHIEIMKSGQELATFMTKHKVSPFKTMSLPMVQAPIFISFFWALRKMASTPVESFKEGGMLWFVDLTSVDQLYALPAITCITLWFTLEVGADFSRVPSASLVNRYMPYIIRIIPLIVFPFIMNFPSALCIYWATTNFVSLMQVAFLKIPVVRRYFQIPEKKEHTTDDIKTERKGVKTDFKSAFGNMKIAKEIAERERLDEANFKRAGRLPPAKTYKYNPTLTSQTVQAKKQ